MTPRILRFPVDGWVEPGDAYAALYAADDYAVWLDSGADAVSGMSYLAAADEGSRFAVESVTDGHVVVGRPGGAGETRSGTMLDFLAGELIRSSVPFGAPGGTHPHDDARFALGWIGWLGYESGAAANGMPVDASRHPDAAMLYVDRAIAFDHESRTIELIALEGPGVAEWAARTQHGLAGAAGAAVAHAAGASYDRSLLHWRHDDETYLDLIRACQEAITAGDAYQLCLTNEARAEVSVDPVAAYLRLRASSPTHHGGLIRFGPVALLSSTPEQFLSITPGRRIRTKPIKGTRPRGATVSRDLDLRAELEASDKERAENVMIVDLMRNDLGRVCEVGSVEVHHLLAVESYAQVHQLVSTIEGRLANGVGPMDAVRACFPAGSMTGAPKISAMRILHRLEAGPRGIYAGCFGYVSLDGSVDLAMVIRSIVVEPERVSLGAGGGITALSVPSEELDEVRVKAAALVAALGL